MNQQKKKTSPVGILIFIGVIALFSVAGDLSPDAFIGLFAMFIFLLPVLLIVWIVRSVKKRDTAHTHDRIDHRSDIRINPKTGKAEHTPVRNSVQHSPQEHWKQQVDALLANGTIDRNEYRAMLKRKF